MSSSCCTAHLYVGGYRKQCMPEVDAGGKLKCPQCVEAGFSEACFCSKKCFKRVWQQHKRLHALWGKINKKPTAGHKKGVIKLDFGDGEFSVYFGEVHDAPAGPHRNLLEKLARGNGSVPGPYMFSGIGEIHMVPTDTEDKSFDVFEGNWLDGKPVGGTVKLTQGIHSEDYRGGHTIAGNIYAGNYIAAGRTTSTLGTFLPHGRGIKIYGSNGDTFIGNWNMDNRDEGRMTSASGDKVYDGKVINNLMRKGKCLTRRVWKKIGTEMTEFGIAIPKYQVDEEDIYEGEYNSLGAQEGRGSWTWGASGDKLDCCWVHGSIDTKKPGIFTDGKTGKREVIKDAARFGEFSDRLHEKALLFKSTFRTADGTEQEIVMPLSGNNAGRFVLSSNPGEAERIADVLARGPQMNDEELEARMAEEEEYARLADDGDDSEDDDDDDEDGDDEEDEEGDEGDEGGWETDSNPDVEVEVEVENVD